MGTTMTRRIRLACESCDYAAEMVERVPFALDAASEAVAVLAGSEATPDGYLSDWLCGECRRSVRVHVVEGTASAVERCPMCRGELLSFDAAARELAEASRSRVWRDLAVERDGAERLRAAMESVAGLEEERQAGEITDAGGAGCAGRAGDAGAGRSAGGGALRAA